MSQHDYSIANQTGLEFRADMNNVLAAIVTDNSGSTEPATTFPGMMWRDTSVSPSVLKKRNDANNAWVTILTAAGEAVAGATDPAAQRTALGAQATLVSGDNIKTINGVSLLGSGNMLISTSTIPSGCVSFFAMSSAPTGWLKANGALISRTTYAALFAAIGTTFGVGDGSTTFALPDLRGEFLRGYDDGRGVDSGHVFGSSQADELRSHSHYMAGSDGGGAQSASFVTSAGPSIGGAYPTSSIGGSETRPRNIALLACIKF